MTDDAGLIEPTAGCNHVVSIDTLIAGVHFLPNDPAALIARKLLRVNLSDLASMGARPVAYLLAVSLPNTIDVDWLNDFASGLAADQQEFGVSMLGGDTTATQGPLTLTATAIGEVPEGEELRRATARPGDVVYVSGTIGDAALGLRALDGDYADAAEHNNELIDRYRLPRPRIALGMALRGIASAAIDVSDGLVSDLAHICNASCVAAQVMCEDVPLSRAAGAAVERDATLIELILTGGDDYELLFTADRRAIDAVNAAARRSGVNVTAIGHIEPGTNVTILDHRRHALELSSRGYRHF